MLQPAWIVVRDGHGAVHEGQPSNAAQGRVMYLEAIKAHLAR